MKTYAFYGWKNALQECTHDVYPGIHDPRDLYDALSHVWCADTCAPRMRDAWKEENPTWGQCSITAFLVQDIFGGRVYGIRRPGGHYHCFNVLETCTFDLTSEQFGDEVLDYSAAEEQMRAVHFAKEEKKGRYELLSERLHAYLEGK